MRDRKGTCCFCISRKAKGMTQVIIFENAFTTISRSGRKWRGVAVVDNKMHTTREKYNRAEEAQRAAVTLALQNGAKVAK